MMFDDETKTPLLLMRLIVRVPMAKQVGRLFSSISIDMHEMTMYLQYVFFLTINNLVNIFPINNKAIFH
jgi:hypothetical protein